MRTVEILRLTLAGEMSWMWLLQFGWDGGRGGDGTVYRRQGVSDSWSLGAIPISDLLLGDGSGKEREK